MEVLECKSSILGYEDDGLPNTFSGPPDYGPIRVWHAGPQLHSRPVMQLTVRADTHNMHGVYLRTSSLTLYTLLAYHGFTER